MHAYLFQILFSTLLKIFHVINEKFQLFFEFSNIDEQARIPPYSLWCIIIVLIVYYCPLIYYGHHSSEYVQICDVLPGGKSAHKQQTVK